VAGILCCCDGGRPLPDGLGGAGWLAARRRTPPSSQFHTGASDWLRYRARTQARFFSHEKIEGVAALDGGRKIVLSNDSDFGISGVANSALPWQLQSKISPATGKQDDGEYLSIDMSKLPAATSTATLTIHVTSG
jgi:hypothetical protein